jgi:hypothetical protein
MGKNHTTKHPTGKVEKPAKPRKDFGLCARATGRRAKKVLGKMLFGVMARPGNGLSRKTLTVGFGARRGRCTMGRCRCSGVVGVYYLGDVGLSATTS